MAQLTLFEPPAPLLAAADADDPDAENPAVAPFEAYLRDKGAPFVLVTNATRAIFRAPGHAGLMEHFDVLVYSSSGPNLLVSLPPRRDGYDCEAELVILADWERIFGEEFIGALAWACDGPERYRAITRADFEATRNPTHARDIALML